jgi:hypothetical protein
MKYLIERLRAAATKPNGWAILGALVATEAADALERLTAENAALRAAAGKVQCFHCGNLISEAWTRLGPCPSCADLRKLLGEKP